MNEAVAIQYFQELQQVQTQAGLALPAVPRVIEAPTQFHWQPESTCATVQHPYVISTAYGKHVLTLQH